MATKTVTKTAEKFSPEDEVHLTDIESARAVALDVFGEGVPLSRDTVLGVLEAVEERAGDIEEGNPDVETAAGELKEAVKLARELAPGTTPAFALAVYNATYGAYEVKRGREKLVLAEVECLRANWEKVVAIGQQIFGDAYTHLVGVTIYGLTFGEYEDEAEALEAVEELKRAALVSERAFGPEGRLVEAVFAMYARMFGEDGE